MLPIVAVVAVCGFLVLHFTGVLDDLGQRRAKGGLGITRSLKPAGHSTSDRDMDRRLKVFESFVENLTKPNEDGDDEPTSSRPNRDLLD
jgi:hypothetical protein